MRKGIAILAIVLSACWVAAQPPKAPPEPPAKGVEVVVDGLKSIAPAAWIQEKPANLLRSYQFRVPRADGDTEDAEVFILNTVQGSVEDNLTRWKDMFVLTSGMPKEKAMRQYYIKNDKATLTCLDIQGAYLVKQKPVDTAVKESRPDYRMIAALWMSKDSGYSIRLLGPKKTVELNSKAYEQWLRNFK
jgi:hypothetical protein